MASTCSTPKCEDTIDSFGGGGGGKNCNTLSSLKLIPQGVSTQEREGGGGKRLRGRADGYGGGDKVKNCCFT